MGPSAAGQLRRKRLRIAILEGALLLLGLVVACGKESATARPAPPAVASTAPSAPAAATEPASAAADSSAELEDPDGRPRLRQKLTSFDGVVVITADTAEDGSVPAFTTFHVDVDGREVLSTPGSRLDVHALIPEPRSEGGTLVLLESQDGGNACEMLFHLLRLRNGQRPWVSPEFGTCAGPEITTTGDRVRLRFEPSAPHWAQREPGFRMPPGQVWEYRAGRLRKTGTFRVHQEDG
jgi:hypothetical protein